MVQQLRRYKSDTAIDSVGRSATDGPSQPNSNDEVGAAPTNNEQAGENVVQRSTERCIF